MIIFVGLIIIIVFCLIGFSLYTIAKAIMLYDTHDFLKKQLTANQIEIPHGSYHFILTHAISAIRNNNKGLLDPLQN